MRRVLIFLLILTVPIGFLLGAHRSIDALQNDVQITATHVLGDPQRIDGMQVQLLTTCGDHMWWETDYTAGGDFQTEFHFTQNFHGYEQEYASENFSFFATTGCSMSTSGGDGFTLSADGLSVLADAVAERTAPGESRTEELLLADYVDVYPMEYWVSIVTDQYVIDIHHDSVSGSGQFPEEDDSFSKWMELFRFPVLPEAKMEVTVEKDLEGKVRTLSYYLIDGPDLGFTTVIQGDGMYFTTVFQNWDGMPIGTGEFPQGYGLYYIPFKPAEGINTEVIVEENVCVSGTFDFDNLRLLYSMEPSDVVVAMETDKAQELLHMIVREEDAYRYYTLSLSSGEILHQVEILPAVAEDRDFSYQFFLDQELLFVKYHGQAALVDISDEPEVEFTAAWPQEAACSLPTSIVYRDGVLYMTAIDWIDSGYGFYLAVLDEDGLGYYGQYSSNLNQNDRSYGSDYINLQEVAFTEG